MRCWTGSPGWAGWDRRGLRASGPERSAPRTRVDSPGSGDFSHHRRVSSAHPIAGTEAEIRALGQDSAPWRKTGRMAAFRFFNSISDTYADNISISEYSQTTICKKSNFHLQRRYSIGYSSFVTWLGERATIRRVRRIDQAMRHSVNDPDMRRAASLHSLRAFTRH